MYGKKMVVLTVTMFLLGICLINTKTANAKVYPDVQFDSNGHIEYDPATQILHLVATDMMLTHSATPGDFDFFGPSMVSINLSILVDNTGHYLGDAPGFTGTEDDMVEKIDHLVGTLSLRDLNDVPVTDWAEGNIILNGDVKSFTSKNVAAGLFPTFEFVIEPWGGKFIDKNIFPPSADGLIIRVMPDEALDINESWGNGFMVLAAKGDKFPTPEPASILLLGLGFLGLVGAGVSRKRG